MSAIKQVPSLRFIGFTDAWELRKLGDVCLKTTGGGTPSTGIDEYWNGDIPWFQSSDFKEGNVFISSCNKHISQVGLKKSAAQFVPDQSIAVVTRVGFGKLALIPFQYTTSQDVLSLSHLTVDPMYGVYLIYKKLQSELKSVQGTSIKGITKEDLLGKSITTSTNRVEQQKIGSFFRNLDDLITLHQRKYEKLVSIKKSMLEKMFPKNGERVPEVRFSGFTDAWELRELGELADKVTEKNGAMLYSETFTNSAENGIISQRDYFDHDISNSENLDGYYVVGEDDFVYNPRISTSAPVGPINRNKLNRKGVMSPLYTVFRIHDVDATYLEHFFKSDHWHAFMYLNGDSGARSDRFSIKDSVFMEMPIAYPCIAEQKQIGLLFDKIVRLITLHQRKYERLQNLKKAYLERMFV